MILEGRHLDFSYRTGKVLSDVSIRIRPGVTALIGPNAAGKSTLLRCLCGMLRPSGEVLLDGQNIREIRPHDVASRISFLPQNIATQAALTVFETVLLGRVHQLRWHISRHDSAFIAHLLEEFGIADLADRCITELSGGQLQMVAVAQAVAREPAVLLLDEPNTGLDLQHQIEISHRICELTAARGISTVLSVHDMNMAARVADTVYVLERGVVRCSGAPKEVLTAEMIEAVYKVSVQVSYDQAGFPFIVPTGLKLNENRK